jgi:hypothetical protein
MASRFFKGTLFFAGPSTTGWSENYYLFSADYGPAKTTLGLILNARLGILCPVFDCVEGRLSDDTPGTRDSELLGGVFPQSGTWVTARPGGIIIPQTQMALMCRQEASPFARGTRSLHGVDLNESLGQDYSPEAGFITALNAYVGAVLAATCYMKINDKALGKTYSVIVSVVPRFFHSRRTGRPFGQLVGRRRVR